MTPEIEYTVSEEDVLLFNDYHEEHSPSAQSSLRRQRYGMPVFFLGCGTLLFLLGRRVMPLVSFAIISGIWIVWFPEYMQWHRRRVARKMYREGDKRDTLYCQRRLQIRAEGLGYISKFEESLTKWAGVEKVVSTNGYTFVYTGALTAHVIPKHAITQGDYEAFVKEIQSHVCNQLNVT